MGRWLGIVGEGFNNDDGSSRQAEIARCREGETAFLQLDPGNRYDPNCVKVLSQRGVQIGNLSKEHAAVFAPHLRAGNEVDAEIVKINGGTSGKPSRGVVIEVDVDRDDFERALEHVQTKSPATPTASGDAAPALQFLGKALGALLGLTIAVVGALLKALFSSSSKGRRRR